MSDSIEIQPLPHSVNASITPPGSKSLTNRALMIAAMTTGKSTLTGALDSDDTIAMLDSLQRLGVKASHDAASATMTVEGVGGNFPNVPLDRWSTQSKNSAAVSQPYHPTTARQFKSMAKRFSAAK